MRTDRLPLALVPFLLGGITLSFWLPLEVFPERWIGMVAGLVALVAGMTLIVRSGARSAADDLQGAAGLLLGYVGVSLAFNSWWPVLALVPALIGIVKWRAVRIQTGRRQPR